MAGDATHGFDLVIEFAEQLFRDLLGVVFDTDGFLADILGGIGVPASVANTFQVEVAMDAPAGIALPAGATDFLDIHVFLGDGGSLGDLRIIAGVDVDRSSSTTDLVHIDLANRLFFTSISVAGFNIPGLNALLATRLRNTIRSIPLLPVPVTRGTTDPVKFDRVERRVIDDTRPEDRDALAALLTFGGGRVGNAAAFTSSFVSPGGRGGIAIGFPWICRVISPKIDDALNLAGAFTDCTLTRTVRIDSDNEVDLTSMSLRMKDGFIELKASIRKTGFCYEATGSVTARIRLAIENGRLIVSPPEIDDPDIDVDIPWYCYLGGIVLGALLGGILFGVIGAIVGGIIVPLIMYLTTQTVEGVIEAVADRVAGALNDLSPGVDVPAVGINVVFSDVFIDDVEIQCAMTPIDTAPIRTEGVLRLGLGSYVDLDNGRVGDRNLASADLAWEGQLLSATLRAVCGAGTARTGRRDFNGFARSALYRYHYERPLPVPFSELAALDPFGILHGDGLFDESDLVYAVHTNEDRYAIVQVTNVEFGFIDMRYRTWEKRIPTLQIVGGFKCGPDVFQLDESVRFVGSDFLFANAAPDPQRPDRVVSAAVDSRRRVRSGATSEPDPCAGVRAEIARQVPPAIRVRTQLDRFPLADRRIGDWFVDVIRRGPATGRFDARYDGLGTGVKAGWSIDGIVLDADSGSVTAGGVNVTYEKSGTRLVLHTDGAKPFEFNLECRLVDDAVTTVTAQRCVHFDLDCRHTVRHTPPWKEYLEVHEARFGIVEVTAERAKVLAAANSPAGR